MKTPPGVSHEVFTLARAIAQHAGDGGLARDIAYKLAKHVPADELRAMVTVLELDGIIGVVGMALPRLVPPYRLVYLTVPSLDLPWHRHIPVKPNRWNVASVERVAQAEKVAQENAHNGWCVVVGPTDPEWVGRLVELSIHYAW